MKSDTPPVRSLHSFRLTGRFARIGIGRMSVVEFLIALVLLLVTAPFVEKIPRGDIVESLLMTLVLVFAVLAVGQRGRISIISLVLVLPALVGKWLHHAIKPQFFLIFALIFLVFVLLQLGRFILRAPRVNTEVLCAGISTYLLLGVLWAFAYTLVDAITPGSFLLGSESSSQLHLQGDTAFYFSFITLSTVGYGDITPVSSVARMLAATEAITGTLFVAVFISRLVALYSTTPQPIPENENPPNQKPTDTIKTGVDNL